MSDRRRQRRGRRRARSVAKRLVLAFLVTVVPLSLQGCALLGFLGSILSAVAPLLGPATQMIGAIAGAGGGGGGGAPISAGGGGMNIPQRPNSQSTFQPVGTGTRTRTGGGGGGGGGGGQKPVPTVQPADVKPNTVLVDYKPPAQGVPTSVA